MLRRRFSFKELFPSSELHAIYKLYRQTREAVGDSTNPYLQNVKAINLSIYRGMHLEYEKNIKPQLQNSARIADATASLASCGYTAHFPAGHPFCELRGRTPDHDVTLTVKGYLERDAASARRREDQPDDFVRELRAMNVSAGQLLERSHQLRERAEAIDERYMFKYGGYYLTPAQNEFHRAMFRERARQDKAQQESELFDFTTEFLDILPIEARLRQAATGATLVAEGQIVDL